MRTRAFGLGWVLRGDVALVEIGREAHIGDNAVVHASTIGDRAMIGHGAVLDDAVVEEGVLIGFNTTVNTDVRVGDGCIVAAGTAIPEGHEIPAETHARGVPARVTPLEDTTIDPDETFRTYSSGAYTDLAKRHDDLFEQLPSLSTAAADVPTGDHWVGARRTR